MARAKGSFGVAFLAVSYLGLAAVLAGSGVALAGVEPSPWHTVIWNRTDRLDPSSPFYNREFLVMELTVRVTVRDDAGNERTTDVPIPIQSDAGGDLTLAPGQPLAFGVNPADHGISPSAQILKWSFSVKGVEPMPWCFAFESRLSTPPDPYAPPLLSASYLTGEMPILGFASPGVVLGSVQLVFDGIFYDACPSVPPAGSEWKNHGQYVRCIAHRAEALVSAGTLTQEEADAAVSAAAQSETGK